MGHAHTLTGRTTVVAMLVAALSLAAGCAGNQDPGGGRDAGGQTATGLRDELDRAVAGAAVAVGAGTTKFAPVRSDCDDGQSERWLVSGTLTGPWTGTADRDAARQGVLRYLRGDGFARDEPDEPVTDTPELPVSMVRGDVSVDLWVAAGGIAYSGRTACVASAR